MGTAWFPRYNAAMESLIETLRQKEIRGEPLAQSEQETLTAYYAQWDTKEADTLTPSLAAMRQQKKEQNEAIARLESFYHEKAQRLNHIRALIAEIESIEQEETRLLSAVKG